MEIDYVRGVPCPEGNSGLAAFEPPGNCQDELAWDSFSVHTLEKLVMGDTVEGFGNVGAEEVRKFGRFR